MAAVSKEFEEYVAEQLEVAGSVESRRMFGGVGLYLDGVFCALIDRGGQVYLRVGDSNRAHFEAEGMEKFQPGKSGGGMPYYEVPARVLEDPGELRQWALEARAVAEAAAKAKPGKRKAKSKPAPGKRSSAESSTAEPVKRKARAKKKPSKTESTASRAGRAKASAAKPGKTKASAGKAVERKATAAQAKASAGKTGSAAGRVGRKPASDRAKRAPR